MKQWAPKKNGPGDVLTVGALELTVWSAAPDASLWAHDQGGMLHNVKLRKGKPSVEHLSYDWRVVKIMLDALSTAEQVFTTSDFRWTTRVHHTDRECVPNSHRPIRYDAVIALRAVRDGARGHEACAACCLSK